MAELRASATAAEQRERFKSFVFPYIGKLRDVPDATRLPICAARQ
jgi:hypothetical protein